MPPSRIAERVERLLIVVPYALRYPGTTLDELARVAGVSTDDLFQDLELLRFVGLPPYTPGDLIEVDIEQDGEVYISMAGYFERPTRLTPAEALVLYLKGTALLGSPGLVEAEALRSALAKLQEHLTDVLGELRIEVGEGERPSGPLDAVRSAAAEHRRIEIDYQGAADEDPVTRRIDPEHVISALGHWYAVAWDHLRDDERLFRIDRIREVRRTGETFTPRGLAGTGRALYSQGERDETVRLRLEPQARWIIEYLQDVDVDREVGDALEVSLPSSQPAALAGLVLRARGAAKVLAPAALAAEVARISEAALARYR